jgi:diphthamide synthase (EF-2-diphthine--ammonia ligase)
MIVRGEQSRSAERPPWLLGIVIVCVLIWLLPRAPEGAAPASRSSYANATSQASATEVKTRIMRNIRANFVLDSGASRQSDDLTWLLNGALKTVSDDPNCKDVVAGHIASPGQSKRYYVICQNARGRTYSVFFNERDLLGAEPSSQAAPT